MQYRLQWPERLEAVANQFFFAVRGQMRWRRRNYQEGGAVLPNGEPHGGLIRRYQPAYADRLSPQTLDENLIWLELLDAVRHKLDWRPQAPLQALDVGCKNFYYAPTLKAFWDSYGQPVELKGIELDAYRVYRDGYSRADYAAWYAKGIATFEAGDALRHRGRYNAISLFYPFVLPGPLVKWGLPLRHYQPAKLLDHLVSLLEPGGVLLVVNQGHGEWTAQQRLYAERGLTPRLTLPWRLKKRPTAWFSAVCVSP